MATILSYLPKGLPKAYRRDHRFLRTPPSLKHHGPASATASLSELHTSDAASSPPPNSLLGLPAEIKQAIFSSPADVASLKALILTCSSMYHAYLDIKPITLTNIFIGVLRTQIHPSVMRYALTTLHCSRITPFTGGEAADFIRDYITSETSLQLHKVTIRDALDLSELHSHVEFFANRFASSALSRKPATGVTEKDPITISPTELIRIEIVLYRFQLNYHLLPVLRRSGAGRQSTWNVPDRDLHLSTRFAPLENEQLRCICDYLSEELSTSLSGVAEYGIRRRARKSRFDKDWSKMDHQAYLSLGLAYLHRLILAKTYDERYELVSSQSPTNEDPSTRLCVAALGNGGYHDQTPPSELSMQEWRHWIPPQLADDMDSGPRDAYYWANFDCILDYWYNINDYWYKIKQRDGLRRWGYVMWDSARLTEWKILDRNWRTLAKAPEKDSLANTHGSWKRIQRLKMRWPGK